MTSAPGKDGVQTGPVLTDRLARFNSSQVMDAAECFSAIWDSFGLSFACEIFIG
jgi:hypothetical protein